MPLTSPDAIRTLLQETRRIALVGASDRPDRASYGVMKALLDHGYEVIPVNPVLTGKSVLGQTVVSTLSEIVEPIDLVDIFRNSEAAGQTVDEAIAVRAKSVWMQLGVINDAAAARAEAAGLKVVMDRCPKIDIVRLAIAPITRN
jgi:predicted CoA-binding protein